MSLLHPPEKLPDGKALCPHSGKRFYAPGQELDEIKQNLGVNYGRPDNRQS